MDIKIKCTKDEFAQLVRNCVCADIGDYCPACIFNGAIADGCAGIEYITDIEIIEDGAADG